MINPDYVLAGGVILAFWVAMASVIRKKTPTPELLPNRRPEPADIAAFRKEYERRVTEERSIATWARMNREERDMALGVETDIERARMR